MRTLVLLGLAVSLSSASAAQTASIREATARRALTVGGDDAAGDAYLFLSLVDAKVLPNGNLAVLDRGESNLRLFDAHGRFLRSTGRKGQGPGEFSNPTTIRVAGNRLLVHAGGNRIAAFDLDGKHLRTTGVDLDSLRHPRVALRHGWVLQKRSAATLATVSTPKRDLFEYAILQRRGRRGADTVATIARGLFVELLNGRAGNSSSSFGNSGDFGVLADSIVVVVDGTTGSVRWLRLDEHAVTVVREERIPLPIRPVTATDLEREERRMAGRGGGVSLSTGGGRAAPRDRTFRAIVAPAVFSVATAVRVSPDGHVWVQIPDDPQGSKLWLIYPPTGAPLRVALVKGFVPFDVHGLRIIGLQRVGADELPAVVAYDVVAR